MAQHNELGKFGEQLAIDFLIREGYAIIETNWVYEKAEIDIIARRENILSIVEVKTRSGTGFGQPQDFVDRKKIRLLVKAIRLLVKAVNQFVVSRDLDVNVRFDIIGIHKVDSGFRIVHLRDAFYYF
jgi:putative endonuclease